MPLVLQTRQSVHAGDHDLTSMAMDRATRGIVHAIRHVAPQAEIQARVKRVQSTLDKGARRGRRPILDSLGARLIVRRDAAYCRIVQQLHASFEALGARVRRLHLGPESQRLSIHSHHDPYREVPHR